MPIEYFTSLELDLVYARWWGTVDLDEFRGNFVTYLADRHYSPGRRKLIDVSGVTRVDLDFQRIRLMLHQVNEQQPGARVHTRTVVWAPDDDTYATGRMYQQLAEYAGGISVEIYRQESAALAAFTLPFCSMTELARNGRFVVPDLG